MNEATTIANDAHDSSERITILLADDHYIVRHALKDVLSKQPDFWIIGEACDGEEAVSLATALHPRLVIIDIGMPKLNGLEATRKIKTVCPEIAVLALTVHTEDEYIVGILQAGAAGYLTKNVFGKEIVDAIRRVVAGEMVLAPEIGKQLIQYTAHHPTRPVSFNDAEKLTARELEILKLAAQGLSNKEIAIRSEISLRTVKGHLAIIFSKLKVGSRTEAVITGLRMGTLSLKDLD